MKEAHPQDTEAESGDSDMTKNTQGVTEDKKENIPVTDEDSHVPDPREVDLPVIEPKEYGAMEVLNPVYMSFEEEQKQDPELRLLVLAPGK